MRQAVAETAQVHVRLSIFKSIVMARQWWAVVKC